VRAFGGAFFGGAAQGPCVGRCVGFYVVGVELRLFDVWGLLVCVWLVVSCSYLDLENHIARTGLVWRTRIMEGRR
jgi:hypothetical protein